MGTVTRYKESHGGYNAKKRSDPKYDADEVEQGISPHKDPSAITLHEHLPSYHSSTRYVRPNI